MVSQKDITEAANEAEAIYCACWEVLRQLSSGKWSPSFLEGLVGFQGILGDRLFALSQLRERVGSEKRHLITKKMSLNASWFKQRMKALSKYSVALKEVIEVGRKTGDNFAWFFYRRNRHLLKKHLAHEDDGQIPTGIGGIGELEFATQFQVLEGKLVIYHGITTFLRVGDASLFDFSKQRIVALLEIKSKQIASDRISVSVFHYGGSKAGGTADDLTRTAEFKEWDLGAKQKDRLIRQLQRMEDLLEPVNEQDRLAVSGSFHIDALERLAKSIKRKQTAYEVAGDGLLLVATRKPGRSSLASRLFAQPPSTESLNRRLGASDRWLGRIRRQGSGENYLLPGELNFGIGDGEFEPILSWGIDSAFVRDAILGKVVVLALYNPAFFVEKLRKAGFGVRLGGPPPYLVVWFNDGQIEANFANMGRVVRSIQERLFQEEAALALLKSVVEKGKADKARHVSVEIEQFFGEADDVT